MASTGFAINISTKAGETAIENLQKSFKELGKESILSEKEMKKFEDRMKKKLAADTSKKAIDDLSKSVGLSAKEIKNLEQRAGLSKTALEKMGKGVKGAVGQLTSLKAMFAGLGIAVAVGELLYMGAQFEKTMATVGGVSRTIINGQVTPDFINMKNMAKQMGEQTEFSATQAAEAMKYLSMAGLQAKDVITAIPGVLDLATAGNIDLATAADLSTNAMSAFGMTAGDLTKINDIFIKTITTSNTDMNSLAEAFKYAAPLAHGYGVKMEALAGYIGLLGNVGIQGSMAGTQLATAFQRLDEVFANYGETTKDGTKVTRDLAGAIQILEENMAGPAEIMEIFDARGGRAMLAFMGLEGSINQATGATMSASEAMREYLKVVADHEGAAKNLANIMRSTTVGAFKELMSTVEGIKLDIFERSSGDLNDSLKDLTGTLRDNKENLVLFGDAVLGAFTTLAGWAIDTASYAGVFLEGWGNAFKSWGLMTAGAIEKMDQLRDYEENDIKVSIHTEMGDLDKEMTDLEKRIETISKKSDWELGIQGSEKLCQLTNELNEKYKRMESLQFALNNLDKEKQEGVKKTAELSLKEAREQEAIKLKQRQAIEANVRAKQEEFDAIERIQKLNNQDPTAKQEEEKLKIHYEGMRLRHEGNKKMLKLIAEEEAAAIKKLQIDSINAGKDRAEAEKKERLKRAKELNKALSTAELSEMDKKKKAVTQYWVDLTKGEKLTAEQKKKIWTAIERDLTKLEKEEGEKREKEVKDRTKADLDAAKLKADIYKEYYEKIGGMGEDATQAKIDLLDLEYKANLKKIDQTITDETTKTGLIKALDLTLEEDKRIIRDRVAADQLVIDRNMARDLTKEGSFFDGVKIGLRQVEEDYKKTFNYPTLGEETVGAFMKSSISATAAFMDPREDTFGDLARLWRGLWDNMASFAIDKISQIIVEWTVLKGLGLLDSLIGGSELIQQFIPTDHEGNWDVGSTLMYTDTAGNIFKLKGVKPDEELHLLQHGEMVIPRTYAEPIRDFLESNGITDFKGWSEISSGDTMYQADESSEVLNRAIKNIFSSLGLQIGLATAGSAAVASMTDGMSFKDVIGVALSPESMAVMAGKSVVSAIGKEFTASSYGGAWNLAGMKQDDTFENKLASVVLGIAGNTTGGIFAGMAGSALGGIMADLVMDSFDVRTYEPLKEYLEEHYGYSDARNIYKGLTPSQAFNLNKAVENNNYLESIGASTEGLNISSFLEPGKIIDIDSLIASPSHQAKSPEDRLDSIYQWMTVYAKQQKAIGTDADWHIDLGKAIDVASKTGVVDLKAKKEEDPNWASSFVDYISDSWDSLLSIFDSGSDGSNVVKSNDPSYVAGRYTPVAGIGYDPETVRPIFHGTGGLLPEEQTSPYDSMDALAYYRLQNLGLDIQWIARKAKETYKGFGDAKYVNLRDYGTAGGRALINDPVQFWAGVPEVFSGTPWDQVMGKMKTGGVVDYNAYPWDAIIDTEFRTFKGDSFPITPEIDPPYWREKWWQDKKGGGVQITTGDPLIFSKEEEPSLAGFREQGGSVSSGSAYWVGENGLPEIFIPTQDGMIIPNTNIHSMEQPSGRSETKEIKISVEMKNEFSFNVTAENTKYEVIGMIEDAIQEGQGNLGSQIEKIVLRAVNEA